MFGQRHLARASRAVEVEATVEYATTLNMDFRSQGGILNLESKTGTQVRSPEISQASYERRRAIAENGNDIIVQTNLGGLITYISSSIESITGFKRENFVGRSIVEFLGAETAGRLNIAVKHRLQNPKRKFQSVEYAFKHADGTLMWFEARPSPLIDPVTGRQLGVTDVVRDITDRKAAQAKIEFANVLLQVQMEASPNAILVFDSQSRIVAHNRKFSEMWDVPASTLYANDRKRLMAQVAKVAANSDKMAAQVNWLLKNPQSDTHAEIPTKDGRVLESHCVVMRSAENAPLGWAFFFQDVTEQKKGLERALQMARFDALTGLNNRAAFVEALDMAVAGTKRRRRGFAVIFIDLDRFKDVNDTLGHAVGDEFLKEVAQRLKTSVRQVDIVARLGGDEFAILVADVTKPADLDGLARKLVAVIGMPAHIDHHIVRGGASLGIELYGADAIDGQTLLAHADMALYRAKANGRGSFQFFTEAMQADAAAREILAGEMRDALDLNQLHLMYKPRIDLATERLVGVEALLRWSHPSRGELDPEDLISGDEHLELKRELGAWSLRTACRQMSDWRREGLLTIRVGLNIAPCQIRSVDELEFEREIVDAARTNGGSLEGLDLEFSEAAHQNLAANPDLLDRLAELGVTLTFRDFGVGSFSLQDMAQPAVRSVKLGPTLIDTISLETESQSVVRAALSLAKELGVLSLADGVRTLEQLRLLSSWGCREAQGAVFGDALAATGVTELAMGPSVFPKLQRSLYAVS